MFTEANTVERMILETASGARAVREASSGYGAPQQDVGATFANTLATLTHKLAPQRNFLEPTR